MVIKCNRIYNKHKYFVSVVEKVMNANVGKILFFFVFFFLFFILHRRHVVGAQTVPSQRDVSFDH